jgi:hypothetical protein
MAWTLMITQVLLVWLHKSSSLNWVIAVIANQKLIPDAIGIVTGATSWPRYVQRRVLIFSSQNFLLLMILFLELPRRRSRVALSHEITEESNSNAAWLEELAQSGPPCGLADFYVEKLGTRLISVLTDLRLGPVGQSSRSA